LTKRQARSAGWPVATDRRYIAQRDHEEAICTTTKVVLADGCARRDDNAVSSKASELLLPLPA